jgi:hypothetical protein
LLKNGGCSDRRRTTEKETHHKKRDEGQRSPRALEFPQTSRSVRQRMSTRQRRIPRPFHRASAHLRHCVTVAHEDPRARRLAWQRLPGGRIHRDRGASRMLPVKAGRRSSRVGEPGDRSRRLSRGIVYADRNRPPRRIDLLVRRALGRSALRWNRLCPGTPAGKRSGHGTHHPRQQEQDAKCQYRGHSARDAPHPS